MQLRDTLKLSDRELQIVQGIFEDQKQETIAYALGISPHSVNTYIQRIYTKRLELNKAYTLAGRARMS